jgi:hypothetical protein
VEGVISDGHSYSDALDMGKVERAWCPEQERSVNLTTARRSSVKLSVPVPRQSYVHVARPAATALVFGQFVGQSPPSWMVTIGGVCVWVALVSVALWLKGVG